MLARHADWCDIPPTDEPSSVNDDANTRPRRSRRRDVVALLLSAALATCSDQPAGPARGSLGYLAIRPVLTAPVDVAAFGLTIDSLRVVVIRPVTDTLADTTAFFDPNAATLQLNLAVLLRASVETLLVHLELRAGSVVLFAGSDIAAAKAGVAPDTLSSTSVSLSYIGPGSGLTTIRIAPRDSVVTENQTKQFSVSADSLGVPVDSFYVSWSTSDTALAPINGSGVLQAPNSRGSVFVRAVTPNGVRDSTRVTFVPVPAAVAVAAGTGQTGTVGTQLPVPLRARVTASDLLGVKGVAVRFQVVSGGGSVKDSVVVTDSLGFAEDTATLGTVTGTQTFRATVGALAPATFNATATAGAISTAQSLVTVSSGTVASGSGVTLTLRGKDQFGNNLTTGGATVAFTTTGGTSTGTVGPSTDVGDGTYTATFTGVSVGTPTTIGATVNGAAVTTALPTVTVTAGPISTATSVVSVASATVASGTGVILTLQAKDATGNNLTIGGATVAFTATGGTSTGTIGATTDNANGTYTATFTGAVAGTGTTIGATIGGSPVTTTLPTLTVIAGTISQATSVVGVASGTVASGSAVGLTLQSRDAAGNSLTTGGATVVFTASGGTSTGTVGTTIDNGNGTYSATFTGALAGTATTIGATIGGSAVTSALPTLTVLAGTISAGTSVVSVSNGTVASGSVVNLTLQARDAAGNSLTTGGANVVFSASGGTSTGTIGATTDNGDGTYTAPFTGALAGTATTIGATIGGSAVTTPLPTIAVGPGAISAATSVVTTSSDTVAAGAIATLTLRSKDAAGNDLSTGGATVVFTASGGTSTGTIGSATDNGDGTYGATFTGAQAGTATTIGATINGAVVTTPLPTILVVAGNSTTAQSIITVSADTVASGGTVTLTLQARDSAGNNLTAGGLTVVFGNTGGTSTGTIGATTDNGDGTYTATFTSVLAGTATTIGATIDGASVNSTLPTITVTPGSVSTATSLVSVSSPTVASGAQVTLTLQAKDAAGNDLTSGGATVVFSSTGGASTGTIGSTTDNGTGTYTATFTGAVAGTATTIGATVNGSPVTSTLPTVTVTPGAISSATSFITTSDSVLVAGAPATLTLQAKDAAGNNLVTGGAVVVFTATGGTSDGTIAPSPATDNGNGTYTATYTGTTAGTEDSIGATVNGVAVTTALPTIRVFAAQTVHSADVITNETWTAAQNPHLVTGYLRIRNGATLTVEDGAVVRFDAGTGLQVGDTTLGQTGGLVMQATPGSITLTANTGSPTPGFWRGIEVQNSLTVPAWTNVLIEWAGGARPFQTPTTESCVLIVNDQGQPLVMDGVTIRQCVHAGIHLFGGDLAVHRSRIDSVTGSGIHVDFQARLQLDSTRIVGSGQEGLLVASPVAGLSTNEFNKFLGNGLASVRLYPSQLRGFKQQDSTAGNGFLPGGFGDSIVVAAGLVDGGGTQFRIFAQAAPYLVLGHLKIVNAPVILMPGLVMAFDQGAGLQFGDSTPANDAQVTSQGTVANPVLLTNRGTTPGWRGLYLGRQSGPTTLGHVHIANGGYSPVPTQTAANLLVEAAGGSGPVNVDGMSSIDSRNHGVVILSKPASGFTVRDDTIRGSAGMGLVVAAPTTVDDSIVRNLIAPGNGYPLGIEVGSLPGLGVNSFAPNTRDTLLVLGGTLTVPATLPHVAGAPWRVVTNVDIDGGALDVAADTVFFDDSVEVRVGGAQAGGLRAVGTTPWRKLFTATPGHPAWWGIVYQNVAVGGASPTTTLRNVIVEKAGHILGCGGGGRVPVECQLVPVSGLRFFNSSTEPVTFDSIVVRLAGAIALDVQPTGTGGLTVLNSQFYANLWSPMIRGPVTSGSGSRFAIHNSDLYHYRADAVNGVYSGGPLDSLDATNNWWGDVAGPGESFAFADSLGRASLGGHAVRYQSFATSPHFPAGIGPAVVLVATTDTIVPAGDTVLSVLDLSSDPLSADSLRVRALDALGRGVSGLGVTWQPGATPPAGSANPGGGASDLGGRVATQWIAGTVADSLVMEALSVGNVRFHAVVLHGATDPGSVNWQVVPSLTLGITNATLDTVTYTSSNRTSVLVTHARDFYGNVSHPLLNYYFFDGGPCFPQTCSFPAVDSIRHDTLFFRPPAVGTYFITGFYDESPISDTVTLIVNAVPATVRIDRNNFAGGVQDTGTAYFNSICPVAGPCTPDAALREFHAFVVDSGATPLGNASARFEWLPGGPPAVFTFDSVQGIPAGDTAFTSAHANGTSWLVVVDTAAGSATFSERDSMPILVDQVGSYVQFAAPDSASVLIGQSTTFQAAVYDAEGQPLPNDTVHFLPDASPFGRGGITLTDTSVFNQVTVRMDSTPFGGFLVEGVWFHPPKDTLYGFSPGQSVSGFASVMNPVQTPIDVGGGPYAAAVNPVTNRIYVTNPSATGVTVIDGAADKILDTVVVGGPTSVATVNPKTNRLFLSQDTATGSRLWAFDGVSHAPLSTIGLGVRPVAIATDTVRNRVYVAAKKCYFDPQRVAPFCDPILGILMIALNGDNLGELIDTVSVSDTGSIFDASGGAAYNPVTDRIYVAVPGLGSTDTVKVIDAATFQVIDSIEVGDGAAAVAVNPVTNRVYVTHQSDQGIVSVIDGSTNTVITTVFMGFYTYPQGIGVDAVRNLVYVSHSGVGVTRIIDGATNLEVGQIFMGGTSTDAQPNPVTGRFYVVVNQTGHVRALRYE